MYLLSSPSQFLTNATSHHIILLSYWSTCLSVHLVLQWKKGLYGNCEQMWLHDVLHTFFPPLTVLFLLQCYCLSPFLLPLLHPNNPLSYQVRYLSFVSIVYHPGTSNLRSTAELSHGESWWSRLCLCVGQEKEKGGRNGQKKDGADVFGLHWAGMKNWHQSPKV